MMTNPEISLSSGEYEAFSEFLRRSCGIELGPNKQYLVATRLRKLLVEHRFTSFDQLIAALAAGDGSRLRERVIDAMTINETFWFRDSYPFEYLRRDYLPGLQDSLRIWCAACSTGQEPYSISMVLEEYYHQRRQPPGQCSILATDVSGEALAVARNATYDGLAMSRGLSPERRSRFFRQGLDGSWQLQPSLTDRVTFRQLNLSQPFPYMGKFDMIFCRNVLIYFSSATKDTILARLHDCLKPEGLLFLGSSESLGAARERFSMVHCNPGVAYRAC